MSKATNSSSTLKPGVGDVFSTIKNDVSGFNTLTKGKFVLFPSQRYMLETRGYLPNNGDSLTILNALDQAQKGGLAMAKDTNNSTKTNPGEQEEKVNQDTANEGKKPDNKPSKGKEFLQKVPKVTRGIYDVLNSSAKVFNDINRLWSTGEKVVSSAKSLYSMLSNDPAWYEKVAGNEEQVVNTNIYYDTLPLKQKNFWSTPDFTTSDSGYTEIKPPHVAGLNYFPERGSAAGRSLAASSLMQKIREELKSNLRYDEVDIARYYEAAILARNVMKAMERYLRLGVTATIVDPTYAGQVFAAINQTVTTSADIVDVNINKRPTLLSAYISLNQKAETLFPIHSSIFDRIDQEYDWAFADSNSHAATVLVYSHNAVAAYWKNTDDMITFEENVTPIDTLINLAEEMASYSYPLYSIIAADIRKTMQGKGGKWTWDVNATAIPYMPIYDEFANDQIKNSYSGPISVVHDNASETGREAVNISNDPVLTYGAYRDVFKREYEYRPRETGVEASIAATRWGDRAFENGIVTARTSEDYTDIFVSYSDTVPVTCHTADITVANGMISELCRNVCLYEVKALVNAEGHVTSYVFKTITGLGSIPNTIVIAEKFGTNEISRSSLINQGAAYGNVVSPNNLSPMMEDYELESWFANAPLAARVGFYLNSGGKASYFVCLNRNYDELFFVNKSTLIDSNKAAVASVYMPDGIGANYANLKN